MNTVFNWGLTFPHGATPLMKHLIFFHEKCMMMIMFVLTMVLAALVYNSFKLNSSVANLENNTFEIMWTLMPSLMILMLVIPSLELLYFLEESGGVLYDNKVKVMGHQWYWSYEEELSDDESMVYDSYMMNDNDLNLGEFRKCEVDRPLVFESGSATRILVTSSDSIHSWAVPEFGAKVDCVPGRLNQLVIYPEEVGRFFGFCSELCGVNHSFMPMVVEVMPSLG